MQDFAAIVGLIVVIVLLLVVLLLVAWIVGENTRSGGNGLIVAGVLGLIAFALIFNWVFYRTRPYVLTRFTAAHAIESTAQFQHKTKLFFEVGQFEGIVEGVCHNFEFSPKKIRLESRYRGDGAMKFSKYGNQRPPFPVASAGTYELSEVDDPLLIDHIESCKERKVTERTGAYELTLGNPVVVVNGIRREGNRAFVDFSWRFESINQVGRTLGRIRGTKQFETDDPQLTAQEKSAAPFWDGTAELVKYDDGWRVVTVELQHTSRLSHDWDYSSEWPDPNFNWSTFDEDENHY